MKHFYFKKLFPLVCLLFLGGLTFGQRTITGVVTDTETGEPLIGATVRVVGTTVGTVADLDGRYSVTMPSGATQLQFTYSGYDAQIITVGASNVLDAQLVGQVLEDVVVIGYGTVKREDATGSVQTVSTRNFNKGAITSATELLAGKVAGVQITTGGEPGAGSTIRIRGGSSLTASNDPLIVIDGVPVANDRVDGSRNVLNILNPNDIESFTVLKDASATAIYGSRASNGVILITTKKGNIEKALVVDYAGSVAFSNIAQKADVLSAGEYRSLIEQRFAAGHPARNLLGNANTDWQSEIYQQGITHDHNISFSGGIDNHPYRISLGYTDRDGILKTDNFNRKTLALNFAPKFWDNTLQFNFNFKALQDKNRFAQIDAIGSALAMDPTQPVLSGENKYGGWFTWKDQNGNANLLAPVNPLARLNMREDRSTVNRYLFSGSADYRFWFLKDLRANLNLAIDKSKGDGTVFVPADAVFELSNGGRDQVYWQDKDNELVEFYLNYVKGLGRPLRLDLMAGYSWQHFFKDNFNVAKSVDGSKTITPANNFPKEYYLLSLFGRANFTVYEDFLLTFTLRRDGSSRFAEENRWGLFPAAALAWKILQREKGALTGLKLRLGYGVTGQQDVGEDYYPYLARYLASFPNAAYQFGNGYVNTLRPQGYDANFKWEETTTLNAALDWGFWDNRLTGSFEVYDRKTTDLINFVRIPAGTNLTNFINTNVGDLENKGFEIAVNVVPIKRPNAEWNFGVNFTKNTNEITRLTANQDPSYYGVDVGNISGGVGNTIQVHSVGYPANSFFVYEQVYDANGIPIEDLYVDRNGDGTVNAEDRYRYKNPAPDFFFGFTSGLNIGKFDFSFAGRANVGNYVYDNTLSERTDYNRLYQSTNYLVNIDPRYTEVDFTAPRYFSDHFVRNASFLRLDFISAGYNFTNVWKKLRNLRLSATIQNPLLITEYGGLDPEIFGGIDNNIYPRSRTFLVGLNVGF